MIKKNNIYVGSKGRKSLVDLHVPTNFNGKLIVFLHGYMGFKDWGCWNLVENYFLQFGFGFCKYNVAHNGCSTECADEFVDLKAFSLNNYTNECLDFQSILSYLAEHCKPFPEIFVIGHSRGGGIALLQSQDIRVKKIATWSAISEIESRFPVGKELIRWKDQEVYYKTNGRTHQEMPHHYSQYEDFLKHKKQLSIETAVRKTNTPLFHAHGDADTSVSLSEGKQLALWSNTELCIIENANHTFGSSHPWHSSVLPEHLERVCRKTAEFFLKKT